MIKYMIKLNFFIPKYRIKIFNLVYIYQAQYKKY